MIEFSPNRLHLSLMEDITYAKTVLAQVMSSIKDFTWIWQEPIY